MSDHYLKKELYELVKTDSQIFEFIQAGSLDGIWYWDVENPEQEWMSERFWTVLGYDPKEKQHLASEWQDIINQDDLAVAIDNFNKHCENPEHPYDQIVRYRHKNGSTVWIRCRGIGVRDQNGKVTRLLGAHTDLTSLKTAESAFDQQAIELNTLEQVVNGVQDAILGIDQNGKVVMANSAATKRFAGSNMSSLTGATLQSLIPDNLNTRLYEVLASIQASSDLANRKTQQDITTDIKLPNTQAFPAEISISTLTINTGPSLVIVIRDLSLIKNQKQNLEKMNNLLSQNNKEMEQFIYTVSHDLRSPLVTIGGYAQRLTDTLNPVLDDKQRHQFHRIIANVAHMDTLLNELLQLSRVIRQDIDKEQLNLQHILSGLLATLEGSIENADARVNVQTPLESINGNERLVGQCLQNLLTNALQYREPSRPLLIEVSSEKIGNMTRVDIKDNGIGIEDKYFDKIFRIFERLQIGEGTGVGLAIVKTIAEKHGGRVSVKSQLDQGSTFSLFFPNP